MGNIPSDNTLNVKPITNGKSVALNNQSGQGATRPNMGQGNQNPGSNPGGTKPTKPADLPVPLPGMSK